MLDVSKESYKKRIANLIDLVTSELGNDAKEVIEFIRDKCNRILKGLS